MKAKTEHGQNATQHAQAEHCASLRRISRFFANGLSFFVHLGAEVDGWAMVAAWWAAKRQHPAKLTGRSQAGLLPKACTCTILLLFNVDDSFYGRALKKHVTPKKIKQQGIEIWSVPYVKIVFGIMN